MLNEAAPFHKNELAFAPVALAIQAQAEAQAGDKERAEATLQKARALALQGKADFATVALAKAELVNGHEQAGFTLLEKAIASDHENTRMRQLIGKALRDTGLVYHGWQYVNMDDGWERKIDGTEGPCRDGQGRMLTNKRFKDMKALTDSIHSLGLKAGLGFLKLLNDSKKGGANT